ncbi:DUF4365 domain-containing protein [Candidatus Pacearchaeota archaeon]|nr:DUF4365 domain-containing protein [Candidatus Pacearchaeota archaeon]
MTEEQIKENLSKHFIGMVACHNGYQCSNPNGDYGADLMVNKILKGTKSDGSTRYYGSGQHIDFQLKATTNSRVIFEDENIKYDLEAKNYNDLISRKKEGYAPLILVLFILPNDKSYWLNISREELILKKKAFWFIPQDDATTSNTSKKRIEIPLSNTIDLSFCEDIFKEHFK